VAIDETSKSGLNLLEVETKTVEEVERDVVSIGSSSRSADNLESVENIGDQSIRFGNEVIGSLHVSTETTRSNEGTNEESTIRGVTLGSGVVDVDLSVLSWARFEVEV